jgi:hypothetical protein
MSIEENKNIQEILDSIKGLQSWWMRDRLIWSDIFDGLKVELNWNELNYWDLNYIDGDKKHFFPEQIWHCLIPGKRKAQVCRRIVSITKDSVANFIPVIQWSITITDNTRVQKLYSSSIIEDLLNQNRLEIQNDYIFKYSKFDNFKLRFLMEKMDNVNGWKPSARGELVILLSRWTSTGEFRALLGDLEQHFSPVANINAIKNYNED